MNQNQLNQVKGHIETFSTIDIARLVASKYGNNANLSDVKIGEYSAKEYVSVLRKVFAQFREEIDSSYAKALPFQYHFQNEYGNGNLHQDLANLLSQINAQNFPASIPALNKLIHYQAVNGFWEKSKRKYFRSSEVSVQEDKDRIDLVSKHVEESSDRLSDLILEIDDKKDELTRFIKSKASELSEIESLLTSARQHTNEITEIHTKSATLEERINSLLEQAEDKKISIDDLVDNMKKLLSEMSTLLVDSKSSNESRQKSYDKLEKAFTEKLSFVEEKREYFEERNQYLDDLIEREVGASLFETFKHRKTELIKSIVFWKWAVPITAIATIVWIFVLFGNGDLNGLSWQVIAINSLKALPAVGLLLFSISQYVKERNFQEEYAFKSAVALTVNSYAEQLEDATNKDKMIMESVGQIYASPIHHKSNSKNESSISSATKELVDAVKSVLPSK
ncbi:hypothetical protein [Shewanella gaetbuli]|uniref:Uncharacterized protein n=1 Tax=Shewanella gaetbuli TaxID=220752 RepID=A0A9X2CME4_9GAMM|nr:hypothetical protein [Shewanella gaetbuli]MCL1143599.1 hypothetical protein [Shewanella gaetbuli]